MANQRTLHSFLGIGGPCENKGRTGEEEGRKGDPSKGAAAAKDGANGNAAVASSSAATAPDAVARVRQRRSSNPSPR